jgi:F420-non-reducing hydrogenase small subunit
MSRKKLAFCCLAGCGGCDVAWLDLRERLLQVAAAVDIVFWPFAMDFKYDDVRAMDDGSIDVCFLNGAIRNTDNLEIARILRQKSKAVIAFGACACWGGVPGLANLHTTAAMLDAVYRAPQFCANPQGTLPVPRTVVGPGQEVTLPALCSRLGSVRDVVPVEGWVPGCPPAAEQVWSVFEAVAHGVSLDGRVLGAGEKSVCEECPLHRSDKPLSAFVRPHQVLPVAGACLLEQGVVCVGPATRGGCAAACMQVGMPCRGCYGPVSELSDSGAKMIALLASMVPGDDTEAMEAMAEQVIDPVGTFYRFTWRGGNPGDGGSSPGGIAGGAHG